MPILSLKLEDLCFLHDRSKPAAVPYNGNVDERLGGLILDDGRTRSSEQLDQAEARDQHPGGITNPTISQTLSALLGGNENDSSE